MPVRYSSAQRKNICWFTKVKQTNKNSYWRLFWVPGTDLISLSVLTKLPFKTIINSLFFRWGNSDTTIVRNWLKATDRQVSELLFNRAGRSVDCSLEGHTAAQKSIRRSHQGSQTVAHKICLVIKPSETQMQAVVPLWGRERERIADNPYVPIRGKNKKTKNKKTHTHKFSIYRKNN